MKLDDYSTADATVHVENVGGINETAAEFSPGVTVLVGRNATNRTSLLRALMAALGSDDVSLKGDTDEGRVELTLGDETYTRRLSRRSDTVVTDGEPYLDDAELADLFAFLLESNEARRAVARGDDLRKLIMRPVDTEAIQARIESLVDEREQLERELEEIEELKRDLPGLEEKRSRIRNRIEEKKDELTAKEEQLESADVDVEEKAELEERLDELRSKRSELDDVRYDLETERKSLEALKRERRELEADREERSETVADDLDELESELSRLRDRKQTLETEANELQSVIRFNEEMLADSDSDVFTALTDEDDEAVTDRLLDDTVTCWTCGSDVDREQIESTLDRLREFSQRKIGEIDDLDERIDDLTEERRSLERARNERNRIERRLRETEAEIEESEDAIDRLQERRERLTDQIEDVEAAVDELENEDYSTVLELHKEANEIEYELGRLETDLEQVEDEIDTVETRIERRDDVDTELSAVTDELTELRTRIDRIEEDAVETFNEHMDTVLERLAYANLERIWIERREREVRDGRRTVEEKVFRLHVVRMTESGTAYEDTVDHLSESEREVTGLVFALAGYLAHEVYEDLPFMLLDSLEAIDSDRIAGLVEYLQEYTGYLVVALLPEDAGALDDEYQRITDV
ncbi:archaea-specific SMC-related protein [Salinirarus marinus]|uniref:archaea-specific SMC-related protein n=1 Tax=Salinirarus marinus TaxID=3068310 RepID=UPI003C6C4E80